MSIYSLPNALWYITGEGDVYSLFFLHESKVDCVEPTPTEVILLHHEGNACLQFLFF
jgi:hypothetical protein